MRDGKSLAADVIVPKGAGKLPVVLIQTPYNRKLMRRHWSADADDGPSSLFTDPNYAFVITDWRGRFDSKDALGTQPANLQNDGFDTVGWIVKQAWSNGRVGTWGASALGKVQYSTAQSHPPVHTPACPCRHINNPYSHTKSPHRSRLDFDRSIPMPRPDPLA